MNIETKWLEDFLSLAHSQSFSRSARERHMTQPAFSRRIRALEDALGCELVDRSSTPVQLTDEGKLFRITARNLVTQLSDSISHLRSMKQRGGYSLDFAVSHTLSLSLFPAFLHSFRRELEGISTRQLVANVDDSVQALKNGICDFLLAFEDPTLAPAQFHRFELQTEQLVPVCRADEEGKPVFNLEAAGPVTLPYLGYPKDIFLGRCVERLLRDQPRSLRLQQAFESSLADSLKVMAMQGMGIAWVPSFAIREELRQGFLVICGGSRWQLPLNVCLYRCRRPLSDTAEAFWQVCERSYGRPEPMA
ncbi:LysR substrate-binding domain-containing protein [Oceanimonas baumannii]|uniref:LysR family transcriptional regulator n=1 Tax=Oceanimonas baumannii TaxID=129578 RepID=A0A235CKQ0_9GAMM|nr:LysR substrate-binding domain-containing protein [Oceanimonas baumannii]MCC4265180.1 LysR family transcriptional regulator [Oceanimonas baumannii]OYD25016.1 LysR family transcriptional regulator [Oceanimonas baumannii]TDW59791.1 LysR family transcriptional regulator [Oceanimonas baumannii]